ncbi:uncharacterized protein VTP21DRAFT_3133 [Calcarisporiella thermophila]|uniref:uncharacterized protein n=1 Tax=Calcarisporiella thermophila TaxID=911321 RepID=UPI00374385A7
MSRSDSRKPPSIASGPKAAFHPEAPDDRTYKYVCRANDNFQRRYYKDAITEYFKAIQAVEVVSPEPSDFLALLYSNRSASYFMLRQYTQAKQDADQVVRLRPNWAKGYLRRAEALLRQHQFDAAIEDYKCAIKLDTENGTDIKNRLSKALMQRDNRRMGFAIEALLPGRDIALERSFTSPVQNRVFEYAEMMKNLIYIVADLATRECIAVDACWDVEGIVRFIREENYTLVACIVTHHHFDHVGGSPPPPYDSIPIKVSGLATLLKKFPHIPAYVHPLDIQPVLSANPSIQPHRLVPSPEQIRMGGTVLKFLHTPGHTPGSQCVLVNGCRLLAGDTLLGGICGRTDLPGGSSESMRHSLSHVLGALEDRVVVLPGHDYGFDWTTIGIEREKGCVGDNIV